ncbi:Hypothetical protein PENO1_046560 [Penicillium occitanis (nom. inval.)]|nr:Hypothetical protein PENO1_046560 [Penicillium occitanis (nom. inval.)]PCH02922.1 hypothetical protein PENOC_041030 [Penicillium occitanis (nom. inval.)]
MAGQNAPCSGERFRFISIRNPVDAKDRTTRRLARSHAVARGLEKKRQRLQQSGRNFRTVSLKDDSANKIKDMNPYTTASSVSFSIVAPGPFQLLAAESPRLQALLSQHSSIRDTEPILSVSDELVLQNFQSVLRKGLDDQALLNAVMLTYTSAFTPSSCNDELFKYQTEALRSLRRNLESPDGATSESTLGAILLLAGIEARLGMPRSVQLHMGAIQQLLDVCQRKGIYLGDAIKRAIFWQDLNCSVMTGSTRIVDHTTFSELKWTRYPFSSEFFVVPPGFKPLTHSLGDQFIEILKDVYALQCIRDNLWCAKENVISMAYIDNHQANIQSRLSHLSLQLLSKLQQVNDDSIWDEHPGLLAWMLYIGGAFAPDGTIRSDYVALLHKNRKTRLRDLYTSWPELLEILKQFIWSEKAFASQVEAFWKEISV